MSGYPDQPNDLPVGSPYWFVQGQYGYWIIEQRTVGETGCRDTGYRGARKTAITLAGQLNQAYRQGLHDRRHMTIYPCRNRSCAGWQTES